VKPVTPDPPGPTVGLTLRGVTKRFPGVCALDGVDLVLGPGAVHALVGENGAGKSTLVRILAGALQPDSGSIEREGRAITLASPLVARRLGIAVVHQELQLADDLSVAENVFLGRWPRRRGLPFVDRPRMHEETRRVLASLHLDLPVARRVRGLTVAQRQLVEIARALAVESQVLVLDEPSAVLTPHELDELFGIVRRLRARGTAILYISHRLEEIFALADRVTVLRDGRRVAAHAVAEVDRETLVAEMVGRSLALWTAAPGAERPRPTQAPVLAVESLSAGRRFHDVHFEVAPGEILALAGLVGAGRSSLLLALFGAVPATTGRVRVGEHTGPFANPVDAMAAGVAFIPEDRKAQGLLLDRSVRENVVLAQLATLARHGWIDRARERATTRRLLGDLRVKAAHEEVAVRTLSGGNQQKVVLARWMGRPHRVALLDEPTRGVDVAAKAEIHALVRRLAEEGAAVVVASSELPEVIELGDRIAVLCAGRLAGILDNAHHDVSQETILHLASAGEAA